VIVEEYWLISHYKSILSVLGLVTRQVKRELVLCCIYLQVKHDSSKPIINLHTKKE